MEKQIVFKTAVMGGFDRNSVMDYIKQINKQYKNNEDILTKKIEDLNLSNKELINKNKDLTQTINMLQKELKDKNNESEIEKKMVIKTDETIEKLKMDILKLNDLLNKTKSDLDFQIKNNKELTDKIEIEVEKSKRYESSVMQIGSAMVEAQNKADVIVLEAKNKISKMSEETDNILKIAADRLDEFKVDVAGLRDVIQNQIGSLINKVNNIDEAVEVVQNKFVNYFMETKNMVEKEANKYINREYEEKSINLSE